MKREERKGTGPEPQGTTYPAEPGDSGASQWEIPASAQEVPGRYATVREFARGGMGRVLLVRDTHLDREVALKEKLDGAASASTPTQADGTSSQRESSAARFFREARLAGQLDHPSIVPIYEVGRRLDGTPYYTMKLVRGRTLAEALREATTLQERLDLLPHFLDLCQAVAYAHSKGVIHRDIKPANVMIGEFGETVLIDWGLVKARGERTTFDAGTVEADGKETKEDLTRAGEYLGTPQYMSPEQASGEGRRVGEASDIYTLGAVLYEFLTGQRPFAGKSPEETMKLVLSEEPTSPSSLEPGAPPELCAICLKTMRKTPEARYGTARELAAEIRRFQSGALVEAYDYAWRDRAVRFARRYRGVLATVCVAIVILAVVGFSALHRILAEKKRTELELYCSSISLAQSASEARRFHRAREALLKAPPRYRHWEWGRLLRVSRPDLFFFGAAEAGHTAGVTDVAFSPEKHTIASVSNDGSLIFWDAETGRIQARLSLGDTEGQRVVYARDGRQLIASLGNGTVMFFEREGLMPEDGKWKRTQTWEVGKGSICALDVCESAGLLVTGSELSPLANVWDLKSGAKRHELAGHSAGIMRSVFSHDGKSIATASVDRTVRLWDVETGRERLVLSGHTSRIPDVVFSNDNALVASASMDGTVRLWSAETGKELRLFAGLSGGAMAVAFTPDGDQILATGEGCAVCQWDVASGDLLQTIDGFSIPLGFLGVDSDGSRFVVRGPEGTLDGRSLVPLPDTFSLGGHTGAVNEVAYSPDGRLLASCGGHWEDWNDDRAILWDIATNRPCKVLKGHEGPVTCLEFLPDGSGLITAGADGTARLWEPHTGECLRVFSGHDGHLRDLGISPDGSTLATAGWNRALTLWDIPSGRRIALNEGDGADLDSLAFSPRGDQIAVGGRDGTVRLDDPTDGHELAVIHTGADWNTALAFSHDGRWLATGGSDSALRVFDASSKRQLMRLQGHTERIEAVVFSHEDRRLFSTGKDHTVRIWDTAARREVMMLADHTDRVEALALSPDDRLLATGGYANTIIVYGTFPWREADYPGERSLGPAGRIELYARTFRARQLASALAESR